MDAGLRNAVAASHLRAVSGETLAQLLESASQVLVRGGSITHREGDSEPHLELVVSGAIRVFVTARDGRTMTIRYCRPGALLGAMSLFTPDFLMPATTQALVDTELLRFSVNRGRTLAADAEVAHALLCELSERARDFLHEIPGGTFTTVRQRVVRHLLDLASERVRDVEPAALEGRLPVVKITQQELADAAGTVREVVVRILRELRNEGLVRTERTEIVLLDPARMVEEEWNLSS